MLYPESTNGEVMRLLVQLNFNEIPHLEGFPSEGILQIYIPLNEELGCSFGEGNDEHQVVYHRNIEEDESLLMSEFPYVDEYNEYFPVEEEMALTFVIKEEFIPFGDVDSCKFVDTEDWDEDKSSLYWDTANSDGIKIGGYPAFTQGDLRGTTDEYNTLLFQLDSQSGGDGDIQIGDGGIMNFFINKDKLASCDFNNVLYNWDCC
jgi:uncharacterized protein YwqG